MLKELRSMSVAELEALLKERTTLAREAMEGASPRERMAIVSEDHFGEWAYINLVSTVLDQKRRAHKPVPVLGRG